ncbi:SagB/ThcOx family dehydrogenase [Kribbella sp. NPDC020789]
MFVRRHGGLFAFWKDDRDLHLLAPSDGRTSLRVGHAVQALVEAASHWMPWGQALDQLSDAGAGEAQAQRVVRLLCDYGILESCETPTVADDLPWSRWGNVARLFHSHTRDAPYFEDLEQKLRYVAEITSEPAPPVAKRYEGASVIALPMPVDPPRADYFAVLAARRTHRNFVAKAVSLEQLSLLLAAAFGIQHYVDGAEFGQLTLRVAPNAGARHETEAYVYVRAVQGADPGLYHYNPVEHTLECITPGEIEEDLASAVYDAPMIGAAPVLVLVTAVTERIAYKYRDGRAYRLWLYNVGHVGQTFVLSATALGLGAFQTAAFRESGLEHLLGIDGASEFMTYILGAGEVEDLRQPDNVAITTLASPSRITWRA